MVCSRSFGNVVLTRNDSCSLSSPPGIRLPGAGDSRLSVPGAGLCRCRLARIRSGTQLDMWTSSVDRLRSRHADEITPSDMGHLRRPEIGPAPPVIREVAGYPDKIVEVRHCRRVELGDELPHPVKDVLGFS